MTTAAKSLRFAAKGIILFNTKSLNNWALHNQHSWMKGRNSNEDVPEDLLSCPDVESVCKWLCLFVRRHKREWQMIPTCKNLLSISADQRQMQSNDLYHRIFDKSYLHFWICGRHLPQFAYHSGKTALALFTGMLPLYLQQMWC